MEKNTGLVGRLMVNVKELAGTKPLNHGEEHRARRALDGHCEGPGGKQMADEAVSMDTSKSLKSGPQMGIQCHMRDMSLEFRVQNLHLQGALRSEA